MAEEEVYASPGWLPAIIAKPVISSYVDGTGKFNFMLSFDEGPGSPARIRTYYNEARTYNWTLSSTILNGSYPSLGRSEDYRDGRIVYQWNNNPYSAIWDRVQNQWKTNTITCISTGIDWLWHSSYPSISMSYDVGYICWEGVDETMGTYVLHRTINGKSVLGTATAFPNGQEIAGKPSVMLDVESEYRSIYHLSSDETIVQRTGNGSQWWSTSFGTGHDPVAVLHGPMGAVWSTFSAAPYILQSDLFIEPGGGSEKLTSSPLDTMCIYKRFEYLLSEEPLAYLLVEIRNLKVGSGPLFFYAGGLNSRPVRIPPANPTLEFDLLCRFKNVTMPIDSQLILFHLGFRGNTTSQRIKSIRIKDLSHLNNGQFHLLSHQISLPTIANHQGQVIVSFSKFKPFVTDIVVSPDSISGKRVTQNAAITINRQEISVIPDKFALSQNYPNPFNPTTTIAFDLPGEVNVRLEIFDVSGRLICTLMDEPREAGSYKVIWNGQDDHGHSVASGVYIYRIQAGDFVQSRKLLFMK